MMLAFRSTIAALWIIAAACAAHAADGRITRFWNLTGETITHLYLTPAGTTNWGNDQCRNDPDGSVDFDERLRITSVTSGKYRREVHRQDRSKLHREGCQYQSGRDILH